MTTLRLVNDNAKPDIALQNFAVEIGEDLNAFIITVQHKNGEISHFGINASEYFMVLASGYLHHLVGDILSKDRR